MLRRTMRPARWVVATWVIALAWLPTLARGEDQSKPPPQPRDEQRGNRVAPDGEKPRPRGPAPGQMIEQFRKVAADLNLTEEQKTKFDAAIKTATDEFAELRKDLESMDPRDRRERVDSIFGTLRKDINDALTEEQRQTLRKRMAEQRPGGQRPPGEGQGPTTRPGAMLERFRESMTRLDLTDDQKKKVETILADAKSQFEEIREDLMAGDEQARMKMGELMGDARRQIGELLTTEQRDRLHKMMAPRPGEGGPQPPPGERRRRPGGEEMKGDEMMDGEMRPGGPRRPGGGEGRRPPRDERRRGPTTGPATLGGPAPALELTKLDGKPVRLSSFQGRVGVIVFGSYSSPTFRQHAAALEQLAKQFGSRAAFLIVYTKEAHPAGQWDVDRNKEEGISVEAPKDAAARTAQAQRAKEALGLTIPIAPDTMDDAVANSYGGFPNGAVVIGRDGNVVARQQWLDADGLERRIEQALKVPATRPAN